MLSVSHLTGVTPRSEKTVYMFEAESTVGYKLVKPGDLAINTMWAWMGAAGVSRVDGIVSPAYGVYELDQHRVDPRWVDHTIRSPHYVEYMTRFSRGVTSSRLRLYPDEFLRMEMIIPPLDEQKAIAAFLDAETSRIDILAERMQRQAGLLLERRAALIERSVTGGEGSHRVESSLEWARSLPAHWREAKLTLVSRLGSGHTPSRDRPEWWVDCTVPWITTGEVAQMRSDRIEEITVTREMVSELGLANSSATIHPKGTVVLCRTASAGYSAIMGRDMATSQDFATWTCGPLLRPRYLLLCLRAMRRDLLERLAMGSTHKTIYMPDIEAIRIPLPPVEEQEEIVERTWRQLRSIDKAVDAIEQHIGLLQERKQTLITAAVTGQLDVAQEIAEQGS